LGARVTFSDLEEEAGIVKRYIFVVLTNAREGQDAEFNEWYNNVHLHDVVRVPGFVAAQRFQLASTDPPQSFPQQYLALYEVETDDLENVRQALKAASGTSAMIISPALDNARTAASYFDPITERVVAPERGGSSAR
jgi:hypothetical protein